MRNHKSILQPTSSQLQLGQTAERFVGRSRRQLAPVVGITLMTAVLSVSLVAAAQGPQQCTLKGKAKATAMREIRAFFVSHHATATEGAFTITLKSKGAETERELQRLIEREQACCSGLKFEVEIDENKIRVVVRGPVDEVERARKILPST